MSTTMRQLVLLILAFCSVSTPICVLRAQEAPIALGIEWLITNQEPSGLWNEDKQTPIRDASAAIQVLAQSASGSDAIIAGGEAFRAGILTSVDYRSRVISALANGRVYVQDLVDSLLAAQNPDGGWGYAVGYASSILETSLSLSALWAAQDSVSPAMIDALDYIVSHQISNGGWAFVDGSESAVYSTAITTLSLEDVAGEFDVSTSVQNSVTWLVSQVNQDGGFGSGGLSSPYETGLALAAIARFDSSLSVVTQAVAYLDSAQLANGSWNDDAYSTAEAIRGLLAADGLNGSVIALERGINLVGLPLLPLEPITSDSMQSRVPDAVSVMGWDPIAQDWIITPFSIDLQDGFVIHVSSPSEMATLGSSVRDSQCVDLVTGLNLLTLASESPCYTAATLRADMLACVEVHEWEAALQQWHSLVLPDVGASLGSDFSIAPGKSIFVKVNQSSQWCNQTCSTSQTLPLNRVPNGQVPTRIVAIATANAAQNPPTPLLETPRIRDIQRSNVSSASVTISWVTDSAAIGCINYGIASPREFSICDDSSETYVHVIALTGLLPDTSYSFEVISEGTIDSNQGAFYTFHTAEIGIGLPAILYGTVLTADSTPASKALISGYAFRSGGPTSEIFSARSDSLGGWTVNLGNLKENLDHDVYSYSPGDSISILVDAGFEGFGETMCAWSGPSPQNTGSIVLNPCACDCHGDPQCNGLINILDVIATVGVAFRDALPIVDPSWLCPYSSTDVNCSGATDIIDVVQVVDVAFRNGDPEEEFCDPCP